ncbi:unnamed protein product [Phytomonas sp. Hart1]|nr:unnamed protein product [Phytomonas sp. Hart1]|eukprot:CCW67891.1 unnamed protein product [Phytomonas sp. isolate Hart1]
MNIRVFSAAFRHAFVDFLFRLIHRRLFGAQLIVGNPNPARLTEITACFHLSRLLEGAEAVLLILQRISPRDGGDFVEVRTPLGVGDVVVEVLGLPCGALPALQRLLVHHVVQEGGLGAEL